MIENRRLNFVCDVSVSDKDFSDFLVKIISCLFVSES